MSWLDGRRLARRVGNPHRTDVPWALLAEDTRLAVIFSPGSGCPPASAGLGEEAGAWSGGSAKTQFAQLDLGVRDDLENPTTHLLQGGAFWLLDVGDVAVNVRGRHRILLMAVP
jgi:hypothetical protein